MSKLRPCCRRNFWCLIDTVLDNAFGGRFHCRWVCDRHDAVIWRSCGKP